VGETEDDGTLVGRLVGRRVEGLVVGRDGAFVSPVFDGLTLGFSVGMDVLGKIVGEYDGTYDGTFVGLKEGAVEVLVGDTVVGTLEGVVVSLVFDGATDGGFEEAVGNTVGAAVEILEGALEIEGRNVVGALVMGLLVGYAVNGRLKHGRNLPASSCSAIANNSTVHRSSAYNVDTKRPTKINL
jgi:hypothetical protein